MIFLNLVLFAQSFAFNSAPSRVPLIINEKTGSSLVETASDDLTYQFQMCKLSVTNLTESLNDPMLFCEAVTPQLKFESEETHQTFKSNVREQYLERLKSEYSNRKLQSLVGGLTLAGISLHTFYKYSMPYLKAEGFKAPAILLMGGLNAAVNYYLPKWLALDPILKVHKFEKMIRRFEQSNEATVAFQVRNDLFVRMYEQSVQTATQQYLKNLLTPSL